MSRVTPSLAFVAVLPLLLAGCGSGESGYGPEVKEAFMAACVEDDSDRDLIEVCECTYDELEASVPFEHFETIDQRLARGSGDTSDEINDIIRSCIRKVSTSRS